MENKFKILIDYEDDVAMMMNKKKKKKKENNKTLINAISGLGELLFYLGGGKAILGFVYGDNEGLCE